MEIEGVEVRFGDHHSTNANQVVRVGQHPMLVVDGIASTLISPFDMLDKGATMTLRPTDGDITNADGSSTIPLHRSHLKPVFTAELEDVARYYHTPTPDFISYPSGERVPPDPGELHVGERVSSTTSFSQSSRPVPGKLHSKQEVYRKLLRDQSLLFTVREPSLIVLQYLLRRRERLLRARAVSAIATDVPDDPTLFSQAMSTEDSAVEDAKVDEKEDPLLLPPPRINLPAAFCCDVRFAKVTGDGVNARYDLLHVNSGHQPYKAIIRAVQPGGRHPTAWSNTGLTDGQVRRAGRKHHCPVCVLAKQRRESLPKNTHDPADISPDDPLSSRNALPGEIISMDPQGPVNPAGHSKYPYWFLSKDVATGNDIPVYVPSLDTETWKQSTSLVFDWYIMHGVTPKLLRTDAANIPLGDTFKSWLWEKYKATVQHSAPYAHWQVSVERDVQTVVMKYRDIKLLN